MAKLISHYITMDKKSLYLTPAIRFVAPRYDKSFLASTEFGGSTIEDVTEEEWNLN